jgi:hypothetical protein
MIAVWEKSWWSPGPICRSGDEWLLPRSQSQGLTELLLLEPSRVLAVSTAALTDPNF